MSSGFIVAVWSPKGGVGKTTLATALALQTAQKQRTVLVDGNPDNPDISTVLQVAGHPNICAWPDRVSPDQSEASLVRRSGRLFVLPGPARYVDEGVLSKDLMEHALDSLRAAGFAVIVDLSCGLRDSTLVALDMADRVVMPVSMDLLAITPLVRLVKEQNFLQLHLERFRIVVNRHTDTHEITIDDIKEHSFCPVVGSVPSSRQVARAINSGDCDAALGPASPVGKALAGFLAQLLPESVNTAKVS